MTTGDTWLSELRALKPRGSRARSPRASFAVTANAGVGLNQTRAALCPVVAVAKTTICAG